ncbi:MAG: hypothetical protein JWO11_4255 [Nocardioides sp.]|nr:hypothetical protein [Nocardioides sp.]
MPLRIRRSIARTLTFAAAAALSMPALASVTAEAETPAPAAAAASPFTLWAPAKMTVYAYGKEVWSDLGLRLIAQGAPLELWSTRASYDDPIQTVWRTATGDVALPAGSMQDFNGLSKFLHLSIDKVGGGFSKTMTRTACLNSYSERVRPDAPVRSPYPRSCFYNTYSVGSVQGVQEGWSTPVLGQGRPLHLNPGRYDVTATIDPAYAAVFGVAGTDTTRTLRLVVKKDVYQGPGPGPGPGPVGREQSGRPAQPAAHEPARASGGRVADPKPDLRSLPAWSIRMAGNGNYLQFSATVWNAGDSPLVVDGFRRAGEDEMDAYQYFFDGAGNQTGYQQVGQMHWDPRPTHQHWHFEDFASYTLLKADKTEVVKSRKEAFCLANTDAVDQTVPNAAWNVDNSDLATACGDYGALSVREVLASGWGDTYAQFRAGQSFDLKGLPNGTYYIAVTANPNNTLVEASTDNNQTLRKVHIGGSLGHRTVRVDQVGVIVEPSFGF